MDSRVAEQFFAECSVAFAFLGQEYGFSAPTLEVDHEINFVTVAFLSKVLAIECIYDERERDIDVKISLLHDGKRPTAYAVDDHGRRIRVGLVDILLKLGIRQFGFRKTQETVELSSFFRVTLADYASLLRRHHEAIVDKWPTIFDVEPDS